MAEEEVATELEAVQAVYGDDCVILDSYPPNLHLHIKPRTADVSSEQFVEAVIGIRAGSKYPVEPPRITLIESKGLDKQRQEHLICSIQEKVSELSSCSMLVALCEDSVEKLSCMNHPDGDCPLCLYPLVPTDSHDKMKPFMKLMSCFHCFHSECIIRWWNWLQSEKESNAKSSSPAAMRSSRDIGNQQDLHGAKQENMGMCPVCRKVFHVNDLEHVLDLVGSQSSQKSIEGTAAVDDSEELLESDSENIRRQKFETILKLQQERSGLIEPRRDIVVLPGMFLPQAATSTDETNESRQELPPPPETNVSSSSNRASTTKHWNSGRRKQRGNYPRNQVRQWIRKDNNTAD